LRNLATNQTRRMASEADGSYRIAALPVGEYEVRVEAQGFKTYVNPIVTLVLGQTASLDITLQTGAVSGKVTVTEKPPAVNPLTGADENQSQAFPLTTRPLGLPRNSLHTPRFVNVDLRIVRYFPLGGLTPYSASGHRRVDIVVEFFNLFNHPNVVGVNPSYGPGSTPLPGFGAPFIFGKPRQARFSIDFEF